jgi:hypothetical protein
MEVLDGGTTVILVLETAWQAIEYVKAVRTAEEARQKVLVELIRARTLLFSLSDVAEHFKNDEWSRALQSIGGPNGVLSDFRVLLEWIMDEMGVQTGLKEESRQQNLSPGVPKVGVSSLRLNLRRMFSSCVSPATPYAHEQISNVPGPNHYENAVSGLKDGIKDIKWPFKEAEVQGLLDKLEGIKTHLLLALSSDNVRLSKVIRDQLQYFHGEFKAFRED